MGQQGVQQSLASHCLQVLHQQWSHLTFYRGHRIHCVHRGQRIHCTESSRPSPVTNCKCCTSSGGGNLTFYCTEVREYIVYTKVREYTVQSPAGPRQSLPAGAAPAVVAFMVAMHILQRSENTLYRDQKILPSNIKHGSGNWKS